MGRPVTTKLGRKKLASALTLPPAVPVADSEEIVLSAVGRRRLSQNMKKRVGGKKKKNKTISAKRTVV